MNRVITLILSIALVATLSVAAFAAGFVSSPSKEAPIVSVVEPSDPADANITIGSTSYNDRADLPEELRVQFEKAYEEIAKNEDLTALNSDVAAIADQNGVKASELAVSDLFNVSASDKTNGSFKLSVDAQNLDNFAALMCYTEAGEWVVIEDAKVENGKLVFNTEVFGAFAVVVKAEKAPADTSAPAPVDPNKPAPSDPDAPQTGDYVEFVVYAAIISAVVIALVVVISKTRKAADNK